MNCFSISAQHIHTHDHKGDSIKAFALKNEFYARVLNFDELKQKKNNKDTVVIVAYQQLLKSFEKWVRWALDGHDSYLKAKDFDNLIDKAAVMRDVASVVKMTDIKNGLFVESHNGHCHCGKCEGKD
ncbi:MAG: hypothetical protein SNJ77_00020 [Cytophagales bacterium]